MIPFSQWSLRSVPILSCFYQPTKHDKLTLAFCQHQNLPKFTTNQAASLPTIQPSECLSVCLASTLVDTRQLMIVEYSREGYLRLTKQQQLLCIRNRNRSNQIRNRTKSPEEDTDRKFVRTVICNMIKTSRDYVGCLWERREQRVVSESSKGRTKPKI